MHSKPVAYHFFGMVIEKFGFRRMEHGNRLKGDIPALTSLRFFAALYVCLFHISVFSQLDAHSWLNNFFSSGYMAVDFFFILSGFILSHNYAESIANKTFSYFSFLSKRIARVYPVHLITLFIMMLCAFFLSYILEIGDFFEDQNTSNFLQNIIMVHSWFGEENNSYNKPSWSISVEFFAYIIFPFLIMGKRYLSFLNYSIIALILFFGAYGLEFFFGYKTSDIGISNNILRVSSEFLFGIILYFFFTEYECKLNHIRHLVIAGLLTIACLFIVEMKLFAVPIAGWIILLLADLHRQGKETWLSHRVCVYLGQVSYSLYMVHYIFWVLYFLLLRQSFEAAIYANETLLYFSYYILAVAVISVSLLFAIALHHIAEKPLRKWIVNKTH